MPPRARTSLLAACLLALLACLAPPAALADTSGGSTPSADDGQTGGVSPDNPRYRPPHRAKLVNGIAYAPYDAPAAVVRVIDAANQIVRTPYRWGGGHGSFNDTAYDCSGAVSFALNGGNLLTSPLGSSSFMRWGVGGRGRWITVYTNPGHAFLVVAGLRFDTGMRDRRVRGTYPGSGPRWGRARPTRGFAARHPSGF